MTGTSSSSLRGTDAKGYLTRVLFVYAGASYAVLELSDIFIDQLGLPDWFFPGIVVLLLLGLPIVVATALVHSKARRPAEAAEQDAPPPTDVGTAVPEGEGRAAPAVTAPGPWLTWRRAIVGFVAAFALWGVVVAAYMAMRAFGIGPVGSLVAAGLIDERDRIILADFRNNSSDPLLGQAATEAFRIDFSQSRIVTVVDPAYVSQVLALMQRDLEGPLTTDLAREVAIREGIKAIVSGDITPVGGKYVLSAELVSAGDRQLLAAHRETARDSTEIIDAIDRLSKKLRERMGESLKTIRASEPLDRVTTSSLEALRKYSQAIRVNEQGDDERALALLEEAVALDSAFAMAYRKLGVVLTNMGRDRTRQVEALTKAYEHRDRLTDRERYMTLGSYYMSVTGESDKAIAAYQSLLDDYPDDTWAMNNLAVLYIEARDFRRAGQLLNRAIELDPRGALYYVNAITVQVALDDFEGAARNQERFAETAPGHPGVATTGASLASARFDYASAERRIRELRDNQRASELWQANTSFMLAQIAEVQGHLAEAERLILEAMDVFERQGDHAFYVNSATRLAFYDLVLRSEPDRAVERIEAALARHPLESLPPLERPYQPLAMIYSLAGQLERAQALVEEYERTVDPRTRAAKADIEKVALGLLHLADGRPAEAIREFRLADQGACPICILPLLGEAYDAAGQTDSVIAVYERYLDTPWLTRLTSSDWWALARVYERLGGLYELRGDTGKAEAYYGRFVELWEDADPELQPRVEAARRALERLSSES
jgi:tetratricopeptide (TPR) repeat protein